MPQKKILIVSRSFYPQNSPRSFRTTELAKEFSRLGHEVVVLTPKNVDLHSSFEKKFKLTIKDLGQPRWKEFDTKGNKPKSFLKRVLKRVSDLLFKYPDIELTWMVNRALKSVKGYDLLISIAVPYTVHWGVASVRSEDNIISDTWVADCGDPFMGQENDTFRYPFYFKFVEKWFCRKADFLSVPTEGAIKAYYPEFHHKIKVIPQGFRFEEVKLFEGKIDNKRPVFGYAGLFIQGRRDPTEFLEYLVNSDKDFLFHIYTGSPQLVTPFLEKANGRIKLHEYIPREELLYELSKMDFVVNFENVGTRQTPSKLIDYLIVNKPILSIKTGTLNKKVTDEFLDENYNNQYCIADPRQYRIENVVSKFLHLSERQ